jgi:hypothetical protein
MTRCKDFGAPFKPLNHKTPQDPALPQVRWFTGEAVEEEFGDEDEEGWEDEESGVQD